MRRNHTRSVSDQHLRRLQRDRIRLTQHFLDRLDPTAATAECQEKTAELIDRIIDRYPTCPSFASMLVDRLLVGQEGLAAALAEELG